MSEIDPKRLSFVFDLDGFGRESIEMRVNQVLDIARGELVRLARRELHGTASKYIEAVGEPKVRFEGHWRVIGELPLGEGIATLLENGSPPWDMRKTHLPGKNPEGVKVNAEGFMYRSIPMSHGAPGGSGGGGPPMGSQFTKEGARLTSRAHKRELGRRHANKIGKTVFDMAQNLQPSYTHPGKRTAWGQRLDAGLAPLLRPRHVTDVFDGMVRNEKTYSAATGSNFTTFRTISQDPKSMHSDSGGQNWMHPGFEARDLFAKVNQYIGSLLQSGQLFGPAGDR